MHLKSLGDAGSSIATSPHARCFFWSKAERVGTVISPALKNPKKHRVAAAQSITISGLVPQGDQCAFSLYRMLGVIGNLSFAGLSFRE